MTTLDVRTTVRRVLGSIAATRVGARVYRALLPALDQATGHLTGGRHTLTEFVLPTLVLVSTGRHSGLTRRQPLVHQPTDTGWVFVLERA